MADDILITCPKCSTVLDRQTIAEVELDLCSACGGIWLDKGELAALKQNAGIFDLYDLKRLQDQGSIPVPPSSERVSLACPACRGTLGVVMAGSTALDACDACEGLWIDREELESAVKAIGPEADESRLKRLTTALRERA